MPLATLGLVLLLAPPVLEPFATVRSGPRPKQVAFSPDGRELWVTRMYARAGLEVLDAATGKRLGEVDLGERGAVELAFNADGSRVYASRMRPSGVFEVDAAARRLLRRFEPGGLGSKVVALSPDGERLYVSNWYSNDVSEIALGDGTLRRRLETAPVPRGLLPVPGGLLVASFGAGMIERIDLASGERHAVLEGGGAYRHLVADGQRVYVSDMGRDAVVTLDLDTGVSRTLVHTDPNPNSLALLPGGAVLAVSCRGENGSHWPGPGSSPGSVLLVSTRDGRVLARMSGGQQTTGLAVSPDGRVLASTDFQDDRVRLYRLPAF